MRKQLIKIIITGGAGFIGGTLIRRLLKDKKYIIYNFDKLGYASDLSWIEKKEYDRSTYNFYKIDLCDKEILEKALKEIKPDLIIHLAAESHVDRSIDNPSNFVKSNILGTFNLLEATRSYWEGINDPKKSLFKLVHVSTDEVYGSLGLIGKFNENSKYSPRSPYSASKASSDHLVKSWYHTYGLPIIISNCSNNFGPYQFPEKLIPLSILKAIKGEKIPLYGDGLNIRDWLYVEDHVEAIDLILHKGKIGETYLIGGDNEKRNIDLVFKLIKMTDSVLGRSEGFSKKLIHFIPDRPGHDYRYAIDDSKIKEELGWKPKTPFKLGLDKTIRYYLDL